VYIILFGLISSAASMSVNVDFRSIPLLIASNNLRDGSDHIDFSTGYGTLLRCKYCEFQKPDVVYQSNKSVTNHSVGDQFLLKNFPERICLLQVNIFHVWIYKMNVTILGIFLAIKYSTQTFKDRNYTRGLRNLKAGRWIRVLYCELWNFQFHSFFPIHIRSPNIFRFSFWIEYIP